MITARNRRCYLPETGHDHEMARFVEIGCQPIRHDRLVEDVLGDLHHKGVIARK